ncbi:hydroxymethylpyrimidine/phosphomethylpyrimidine kinase [Mariprofundus ferrinatatus]|uniref:hydroxymethylpyrimidine kinase n=1 Tax=Mariprofundus ferrinatatus TaxID=1921087 RepID=A0A2K8L7N5_9PROT|nr:bifunctional hydroxymethylpyrimidine kinase/phosphomethylpyrimidine kinase [Mariprofundus ferrinatatus]ATX82259.1 hydroxymethylpyrimidine/phosphomethylpyrimidine kinase [Mariprofundus ferrinatatus]
MSAAGRPVCLTIGGSDSCSGAGVQADLRVFEAIGVHGCSAITALTAQNPAAITRVEPVSLAQLDAEIHAIFDYFDVAVVKTGMLVDAEHVALVSALLDQLHDGLLVVDPVMVSSSGRSLLDQGGVDALQQALLPLATLVTPNLNEAAVLLGESITDAESAATQLSERLGRAVLLKGGHSEGDVLIDLLCDSDGDTRRFSHERQPWSELQRHGTGCRLASAIAAHLAAGDLLSEAVARSVTFLQNQ